MLSPLNITSRNQGQLYGAKPTLEEIEHQLEADPMTRAVNHCGHMVAKLVAVAHRVKLSAVASALDPRRQGDRPSHLALEQ